ncbi:MAG: hypothetical protein V1792_16835 [Pseudomonadota bacterium]
MQSDVSQPGGARAAHGAADWFVSAAKTFATAFFKLIRWVAAWVYRGVRWVLRYIYNWFMRLDGTGKILFIVNIVLLIAVIVLWLDLDLWSIFYGNQ